MRGRNEKTEGAGRLYLVATPIGHRDDITLRALAVLKGADLIACEDSRVTRKLLAMHGIAGKLLPYHDHNAEAQRPKLLSRLEAGETIALVSDAGTPLISDPGFKLVRECLTRGIGVESIPGPSALLVALQLSGLPSDRFFFGGFLPAKSAQRKKAVAELAQVPGSLIFYESAQRLPECLADLAEILGGRAAAVARELTKLHEEVKRDSLPALARHYAEAGPPRGEVAILVGPPEAGADITADALDDMLMGAMAGMSLRDAAASVALASGRPKKDVYARALALAARLAEERG